MKHMTQFEKKAMEPNEKLVFQRIIGFKKEMPGSGQWYESSPRTSHLKKHYKNDCWICEKHIYSILIWSRGRAYILNPILPASETEIVSYQIDLVESEIDTNNENLDMNPGLGHVKGNLTYEEFEDRIPYITGSFTGWRYKKMRPIHEWCMKLDIEPTDPLELGK